MPTFQKINLFTSDLLSGGHNFVNSTYKIMFSNSTPAVTNHLYTDIIEIAAGGGYNLGGNPISLSVTSTANVANVVLVNFSFTASFGTVGPFRYPVLYNILNNLLVGWWDNGSALTLNIGQAFTIQPSASTNAIFSLS